MNVFYDFAEIILCIYAVVKHIFKRDPSKYDPDNFSIFELIYELTCVVISLVIYVMMILFLLPFVIIRMIIDIYLRRKHGEKYGGLLEEMDALWTADTQHGKHIINALFFMELKKSPEEFVSHLKKCIKKSRNLHFNSTLHNILNYKYRLWCNENVDNVIRLISLTPDERSNKSKFQEKISNLANQSLPSASPLEVLVCAETIVFNDCQDEQINANNYVVIGRFHHSVGDGVSLLSYLLELDNQESNLQQVTEKLSPKKNTEEPKVAYITYKKIVNIIKNTSLYRFDLLAPSDENILHGPTLTGQKILVFEIEHQIKYVPKIKSIRKQFKECRFTDVLHTALSASLLEHFHQHLFRRRPSNYDRDNFGIADIIYELSCFVISLAVYIMATILLLPFVIIRMVIDIYLKWKYGEKYYGLLENIDALWAAETQQEKHIVNGLIFLRLKKTSSQFLILLKNSIRETGDKRFNCTVHNILNYQYRLRSHDIVDKVVKLVSLTPDERSHKPKFEEKISDLANQSLPATSPFEILVCAEPVTFNDCQGEQLNKENYVIITRFHHSTGTGEDILSFLLKLGKQESNLQQVPNMLSSNNNVLNKEYGKSILRESKIAWPSYFNRIMNVMKNTYIYRFIICSQDKNILHGPTLTGQKVAVFEMEHECKYISKMKSIKDKFRNCRFTDVLSTAISASLFQHFCQYSPHNIPQNIHMSSISTYPRKLNENNGITPVFSTATLDIPLKINESMSADENLILRLQMIKTRHRRSQQSVDSLLFYWSSRCSCVLPIPILKIMCKLSMRNTFTLSNLPGVKFIKVGDEEVTNMVFFTPHVSNVGIGFTMHTYGNYLQMGLVADKALIPNSEQASVILKNVCKYIDLLDKKVNSIK